MDEVLKKLFENKSQEEIADFLVNLNRYQLNRQEHIKKYNRLRKLHSEVINSMQSYIFSGKYSVNKYNNIVKNELGKIVDKCNIVLDLEDYDDITVFLEMFIYDNHPNITSVTDVYLEKKKFRNQEKIKMLECMKNSYAGLFKVISADREKGYVVYQDVFTKKKFTIIDIAMSSTFNFNKKREVYTYNRIITFDDISFATGIHCNFTSDSKLLMKFIKSGKYNKYCGILRCIMLYDIYKKDSNIISTYNHRYGR